MGLALGVIGFLGFFVCLIWFFIRLIKRTDKKIPAMGLVACLVLFIAGAMMIPPSEKEDDSPKGQPLPNKSVIEQDISSIPDISDTSNHPDKSVEDVSQETVVYNVDWDQCLDDLKESVLNQEFFPFAKDVYVTVDEDKKKITFSAVVGDSTDPEVALDYADTIVRQYNLMANMQDNNIKLGSKDYYGGLYDEYDILVGIAPQSKTDDTEQWFVFDASIAGAHQKFKLQKAYK